MSPSGARVDPNKPREVARSSGSSVERVLFLLAAAASAAAGLAWMLWLTH